MYILYVLMFMASMISIIDWRGDAAAANDLARADAIATQMASYHQQVLAFCQDTVCPAGPVTPGLAMPWHMREAPIYGTTIRSAYDGTGLFVTYYAGIGAPIEQGRIADALATRLSGAVNAGRYNRDAGQVLRSVFRKDPSSALEQMSLTVPPTVGGTDLPDGVPIVATKLDAAAPAGAP